MKIGIKTKLIVTGIAIIIVSGGTGVYIWQLYLKYFTKEQLRVISAEKERRQQTGAKPSLPPIDISEKEKERHAKSLTEAKESLKAKGWVSSNPNDR